MKQRNPIAKAVRLIKPKVVPNKKRAQLSREDIKELQEYADIYRENSNRRLNKCE